MATSVVMPALEMAQETGKLVSWLKKEGEQVKKGEMLLEVETDKAVVEVEAGADGVLAGILAKVGDVVPVGQTIAWLVAPGEAPPTAAAGTPQTGRKMESAAAAAATSVAAPAAAGRASGGGRVSPKARKIAQEHGVDLSKVVGSGPGGEISADDVLKFAQAAAARPAAAAAAPAAPAAPAAAAGGPIALSSVGRIMAERTTQSWTTVPHFFLTREVDATALNAAREKAVPVIQQSHGVKVTHTDLLVAAVARALARHPRMNASWVNGTIRANADINVALAMAVENAVVTAVIPRADRTPLGDIAKRRRDLADRARANRLQPSDITGATFTISNLGMFAVDAFTAIIVPPQAGILAVGAIADRVVAVNGMLGVRPTLTLTLSSDHRVIDGAGAAQFLTDVVQEILAEVRT
ncbi:MAG TPA: dihydrolipoamide acetyltransferase family protein [Vicinamibacterales bacterium]|nr:dihydrolipoamide acetyltransferase family protein [Vicinamibacterales bacterium]